MKQTKLTFEEFCIEPVYPVTAYALVKGPGPLEGIFSGLSRRDYTFNTVLSKALEKLPNNEENGFGNAELKAHLKRTTETALRALYEITFP